MGDAVPWRLLVLTICLYWFHRFEACQTLMHEQCTGFGSLCFQKHCVAGQLAGFGQGCRNDAQCRRNVKPGWSALSYGCKLGQCFQLIRSTANRCTKQSDCLGQTMCIRQACVPAQPTEHYCRRNSVCNFGEKCVGGLCFEPVPSVTFP
uniref:EB domain-containing protein n=1 Tax=Trichuris muris TaxID=70415 RepID=A0A5S6QKG3_TRIMR